jgi:hypothetical protein
MTPWEQFVAEKAQQMHEEIEKAFLFGNNPPGTGKAA